MVPLNLLNLVIAFLAGFLTFFAGCLAPVAPVYVSFLAGVAANKIDTGHKPIFLKNALLFTLGFLSVFLLLGLTVNTFARAIGSYRPLINKIAGSFLLIFGLVLGRFVNLPILSRTFSFQKKVRDMGALALGASFGFAWTPCVGPVLAAILFWVSSQNSLIEGLWLLFFFAIGLGLPFIFMGLAFDKFWPLMGNIKKHSLLLSRIAGIVMIIFGILLLTDNFSAFSAYLLNKLGSFAFTLKFRQ